MKSQSQKFDEWKGFIRDLAYDLREKGAKDWQIIACLESVTYDLSKEQHKKKETCKK